MEQRISLLVLGICLFPLALNALNVDLKQKYPNTVLTDDYGILNKTDLDSHLDGVKHPPEFSKRNSVFIYWQCFPRNSIRVSLQDLGYSPEDDDESDIKYNGENEASLSISVLSKNHIIHEYIVWGRLPITLAKKRFNEYLKLLQNEPYVCLAGSYTDNQSPRNEWAFIKMKTRKGCVAYHKNGCHYLDISNRFNPLTST